MFLHRRSSGPTPTIAVEYYLVEWTAKVVSLAGTHDEVVTGLHTAMSRLPSQEKALEGWFDQESGTVRFWVVVHARTPSLARAWAIRALRSALELAGVGLERTPGYPPLRLELEPEAAGVQPAIVESPASWSN